MKFITLVLGEHFQGTISNLKLSSKTEVKEKVELPHNCNNPIVFVRRGSSHNLILHHPCVIMLQDELYDIIADLVSSEFPKISAKKMKRCMTQTPNRCVRFLEAPRLIQQ